MTGAGTRLGQAIAIGLGEYGMQAAVHYHSNHEGALTTKQRVEAAGGRAVLCPGDLTSRATARQVVQTAHDSLGGLDLLILSAAFQRRRVRSVDDQIWDRSLNLDLASPFFMAQTATPLLRATCGNIVFITCSSVVSQFKGHVPYVVAKAGLYQLMRALALELAPEVRVNAVAPGFVLPPATMNPTQVKHLARRVPLQQVGNVDDVVRAIVYLASCHLLLASKSWWMAVGHCHGWRRTLRICRKLDAYGSSSAIGAVFM